MNAFLLVRVRTAVRAHAAFAPASRRICSKPTAEKYLHGEQGHDYIQSGLLGSPRGLPLS